MINGTDVKNIISANGRIERPLISARYVLKNAEGEVVSDNSRWIEQILADLERESFVREVREDGVAKFVSMSNWLASQPDEEGVVKNADGSVTVEIDVPRT